MCDSDELLPLSALQHMVYCERQCALIHIEQLWFENRFTAEGRVFHEKAHGQAGEYREGVRIERSVPLRSVRLGIIGKADIVEFQPLSGGGVQPFPVEYKRGKPKEMHCDEIQLCAQAICLEEMTGSSVPGGALFYGKTRHRHDVEFNETLYQETINAAGRLHALIAEGKTPPASYGKKCERCSLKDTCLPTLSAKRCSVRQYLEEVIEK